MLCGLPEPRFLHSREEEVGNSIRFHDYCCCYLQGNKISTKSLVFECNVLLPIIADKYEYKLLTTMNSDKYKYNNMKGLHPFSTVEHFFRALLSSCHLCTKQQLWPRFRGCCVRVRVTSSRDSRRQ